MRGIFVWDEHDPVLRNGRSPADAKPALSRTIRSPLRPARAFWGLIGPILLIPAVAMQFGCQVAWGLGDFLAAAILLGGAGIAIEFAVVWLRNPAQRYAAAGAIVAVLLFVWAELAVGTLR